MPLPEKLKSKLLTPSQKQMERDGRTTVTLYALSTTVPTETVSGCFLLLLCFIEILVLNANSVDPDQMPNSAAPNLGLDCLPMSLLWNTRHK